MGAGFRNYKYKILNYIGKFIYAIFRCDEIYNRLLEIEKETRKL